MKVSTVAAFMLFFQVLHAQYDFSLLDAKLQQSQKQLGGNVVTLVFKDGKQVYKKELGDFNAATPAPIASCSKWLTAALVMQFVDEGKLSLDDYVSKYIPDMQQYGKGYITIRQCLSHTTGIHNDRPLASLIKLSRYQTLEEEVKDFMSKHELDDPPGKAFYYSSIGLNMAGRVLEIIGKKSFDRLMQDKLLRPLGMRNTTFASERAVNPSGGAKSTAADYMNFLQMILNKGMFNGKRILSEKSIEEMQKAQTTPAMIKYAPPAATGYNYALGEWILEQDKDGKSIAVSSPGLFGTWPVVNNQKGYAAIVFVKTILNETRKEIYSDIYKIIDDAVAK
ncbi:serine hydrolase domain-containing protein [Foetidibacter luteolus]|uniref:serine hydrolase domain-containing protein n=1 Tax=Foetidibacter luteolus TaxID=2608880 RepID=UPI001A97F900|nr:serine hydrolase domain-containing protein [Foetidibacter luteolus]